MTDETASGYLWIDADSLMTHYGVELLEAIERHEARGYSLVDGSLADGGKFLIFKRPINTEPQEIPHV